MDRNRFDADTDPNFHFDADPEIRIFWILTLVLQMLENLNFFYSGKQQCKSTLFCLSRKSHSCHNIKYFGQYPILKFSLKSRYYVALHWVKISTTDPDFENECRSNWIRIYKHKHCVVVSFFY